MEGLEPTGLVCELADLWVQGNASDADLREAERRLLAGEPLESLLTSAATKRRAAARVSDDPYVYPGTDVLRNVRDIRDSDELEELEARLTFLRGLQLASYSIAGEYDLVHLQAFHRYLLAGLYEWAGELRTVVLARRTSSAYATQHRCFGNGDARGRGAHAKPAGRDHQADWLGAVSGTRRQERPDRRHIGT